MPCSPSPPAPTISAICCGDLVGYGADPNPVCDWVRANCAVVVRGNHDRASTGQDDLEWFNPVARNAAVWTLQNLSRENADYILALPRGPVTVGWLPGLPRLALRRGRVRHRRRRGRTRHSVIWNRASPSSATPTCRAASSGTSRAWRPSCARRRAATRQSMTIDPDCAYMINPGSSGQPRDGDPRAAYAIYDTGAKRSDLLPRSLRRRRRAEEDSRRRAAADSGRTPVRGPLAHAS